MRGKTKGKTRGKTALKESGHSDQVASHEADQRLFDAAQAVIAQDRVIADSGLEVSRRMNECARDTIEANQIIERKEHEIAAITTKIDGLTATFDHAYNHLLQAQEIAAEAIDSSVSEQFRHKEETNLINILIGITNEIAKKSSFDWPREKTNKCLEVRYLCSICVVMSQAAHTMEQAGLNWVMALPDLGRPLHNRTHH